MATHSVGPNNVSFENFVESTKILDRDLVSKVFNQYEANSSYFSVEVVEVQEEKKVALDVSTKELSELSMSKKLQSLKRVMPEQFRVKDFVINTEDIKLTKSLITRTVEITRFMADVEKGPQL